MLARVGCILEYPLQTLWYDHSLDLSLRDSFKKTNQINSHMIGHVFLRIFFFILNTYVRCSSGNLGIDRLENVQAVSYCSDERYPVKFCSLIDCNVSDWTLTKQMLFALFEMFVICTS